MRSRTIPSKKLSYHKKKQSPPFSRMLQPVDLALVYTPQRSARNTSRDSSAFIVCYNRGAAKKDLGVRASELF